MKAETMMDAIGMLDESLLAEGLPKKRRNFRPLAAAAAVAAALAVSAGAVSVLTGWDIWVPGEGDNADYVTKTVIGKTGLTQDGLALLQEVAETEEEEAAFASVDQLEAALGIDLLETGQMRELDALDGLPPLLWSCRHGNVAPRIRYYYELRDRYDVLQATLNVEARFSTGESQEIEIAWRNAGAPDFQTWEIESLGVTAQIGTDEIVTESGGVRVFFVYENIAYELSFYADDAEEYARTVLESLTPEA